MAEAKGIVLPVYVVVDESESMTPYRQELFNGLSSLIDVLRAEPMVAAKARIAVLGFSDDVQVRLALSQVGPETLLPEISVRGLSNYAAVFDDLLHRIPIDVRMLRSERYKVHRPVVFFLSDGQPTDGGAWRGPHGRLIDRAQMRESPNIVACGIGDAQASTMLEVATRPEFAFVAAKGASIGQGVFEFFHSLTASLVASGNALGSAGPQLVINKPNQFALAVDALELKEPGVVVSGPPGTGKSEAITRLIRESLERGESVVIASAAKHEAEQSPRRESLTDIGEDPDTPAAAAALVEGLSNLFLRLGPPPESLMPDRAPAPSGGGNSR
ncbi:VWA domain-containing protein [Streptomyces griseofuscus]|uniref:VWA domain-containing protein n=1 Tax=Streptomyces griseofuscus TaxID=146922 RepID=UPI0038296B97